MNVKSVRTDLFDLRAESVQEVTEFLHMWFRGGIPDHSITLRSDRGHDGVFGRRHTRFIHEKICAAQAIRLEGETALILYIRAQRAQSQDVCIQAAAADHV